MRIPIVIFAQTPPPEHGQSRMILLALETLRDKPESFEVHHVNARFSYSLEDIGESSFGKMLLTAKYLYQAIRIRSSVRNPILYYVPGPVKWSSVLRDWVLLAVLRLFYSRVVFHWHAIGHGEWAHGSDRLKLKGPCCSDWIARKISACVLEKPFASIAVVATSQKDSLAVASKNHLIVHNGIGDPCPGFENDVAPERLERLRNLASTSHPCFKVLFLSHGTFEKGTIDTLDCMEQLLERCDPLWRFELTFAGGISGSISTRFDATVENLHARWPERIQIIKRDYLTGDAKHLCFLNHDIFIAPSRWESFGLTVLEAMAYGLPIVAASSDGVKGVLPDGYPYLAPPSDPASLAGRMLQCCTNLRMAPTIEAGRALRQRFLDFFQIKDFTGNLSESLINLAGIAASHDSLNQKSTIFNHQPSIHPSSPPINDHRSLDASLHLTVYLADQNPGYDRSYGISRMSQIILDTLQSGGRVNIETIASKTSQQGSDRMASTRVLPWGTRRKWVRLLTDHLHPLFQHNATPSDVYYFPKGYLPLTDMFCRPSVVTIHDTIIQYDSDYYPEWRSRWEYFYWSWMLKHTLREADRILTVSESSKSQIRTFMDRHRIPQKDITVTYEPCFYENIPQPVNPTKQNYVIHLASCEPHKRTAHLIRWWHEAEMHGKTLPMLHLIGQIPPDVSHLLASSHSMVKRPFLEDSALLATYQEARALILPSEIEGFGLPALEGYYLGTPVCYVKDTSVEEVLCATTRKGGFSLDSADSLFAALDEVMSMSPGEIRECGLKLRQTYAAEKVAERMISVFNEMKKLQF